MYKSSPLSTEQVEELRIELNKILQQNMVTFEEKISSSTILSNCSDVDVLLKFSQDQHQKMRKLIENISQFTFSVMSNFDMVWEEVYHRDNKIQELRETFSRVTSYIEELRGENDDIKNKLSQAETYIQWVEQQKEYLDAIYDSDSSNLTVPAVSSNNLNRCVSESSLRWSRPQKKSVNYEKLKDYIESIKHERNNLQKEYLNLNKRYETKCEESRKAHLIIEHLMERLNKKVQFRQYASHMHIRNDPFKCEFTSEDILKILEKEERISSATSLENHLQMMDEQQCQGQISHFFDQYSHLADQAFRDSNKSDWKFGSISHHRKDVEIGTESQMINNPTVQTQTENKENSSSQKKETSDYKISIHISGLEDSKNEKIAKIIKDLDIEQQISSKLQKKIQKVQDKKREPKIAISKQPSSYFDYYCQKYISNRIKKYYFNKPGQVTFKNIMAH